MEQSRNFLRIVSVLNLGKYLTRMDLIFDCSLAEAVQGIALSSAFRVPFTQISENFVMLLEFQNKS